MKNLPIICPIISLLFFVGIELSPSEKPTFLSGKQ